MTKSRPDVIEETERLAADIRARRHANELDVREAAEEMAVVGIGDPQALRRLLRTGRITITDRQGRIVERQNDEDKDRSKDKGKPWIIPVGDVAHAIVLMRRGMTFGGWWAVEAHDAIPALRCRDAPPSTAIDPTPGLDALRGAMREVLEAMRAAVDASVLDDVRARGAAPPTEGGRIL